MLKLSTHKMYIKIIVIFTIFTLLCATAAKRHAHRKRQSVQKRIIMGEPANIEDYPYFVVLSDAKGGLCGGALVDLDKVVTAAHCVDALSSPSYIFGGVTTLQEIKDGKATRYKSYERYVHELYRGNDEPNLAYDMAVLLLTENVTLSDKIATINIAANLPPIGANMTIVGHGLTDCSELVNNTCKIVASDHLMKTEMTVFAIEDPQIAVKMTPNRPCKGDSGGPYTYNGYLVAVESHSELANCRGEYNYEIATSGPIMLEFLGKYGIYPQEDQD